MTPKKVTVAWNIAAVLGVLLLLSLFVPSKSCPPLSPQSKAVNQMKQLSLGCRAYAADWDGELPPTLETLYPDYIDVADFFYAIDKSGEKIPIIYRHPHLAEESERLPLLEWPIPLGDKKLIAYKGGHVTEERVEP